MRMLWLLVPMVGTVNCSGREQDVTYNESGEQRFGVFR